MAGNNDSESMQPKCSAGVDNRRRIISLEENNKKQWQAIEKLQNRPPVWCTAIISLLTFLLGCAVTYAGIQ